MRSLWLQLASITLLVSSAIIACGEDRRAVVTPSEAAFVPVVESSELHVGMRRLVLTLLDHNRQPKFDVDAMFRIRYFDPTEGGIKFHSEAQLQPIDVEGFQYLVATDVPFDAPGQWAIAVTVELSDGTAASSPRLPILVRATARGLTRFDDAPSVPTPTIADGILERMTPIDATRLPMYERSAAEIIAAGEPLLIVWASSQRCAGRRACARAVEQAASILNAGEIAVIHVEPFGRPRSEAIQSIIDTANAAWVIEAEPQLFVIDGDGSIANRFEIVVQSSELRAAIEAVSR